MPAPLTPKMAFCTAALRWIRENTFLEVTATVGVWPLPCAMVTQPSMSPRMSASATAHLAVTFWSSGTPKSISMDTLFSAMTILPVVRASILAFSARVTTDSAVRATSSKT